MPLNRERLQKKFEGNRKSKLSRGSQIIEDSTIRTLDNFCHDVHKQSLNRCMDEIRIEMQGNPDSDTPYDFLIDFYGSEKKRGISIRTLNMRLCFIKQHFIENGIELIDSKFKKIHEKQPKYNRKGVSAEQIQQVMSFCSDRVKAIMMVQASSGMRISEVINLRRKDFIKMDRWMINIRAEITKSKQQRITFISKEAEQYVLPYLNRLPEDSEERVFQITREGLTTAIERATIKSGQTERYEHSGYLVFTSHALRAFFITQVGKTDNNFAHALAGHDFYMTAEYNRLNDQEKCEKYIDLEESILIFRDKDSSKDDRITQLEKELAELKKCFKGKKLRLEDYEEE